MAKGKFEYWLSEDGLLLLQSWARDGYTQEQIAKKMQISRSTLKEWINRFPAISATLKGNARELADIEVENALRDRALGYSYTETTKERKRNPETGEYELVVTKEITKMVIPDVTAQIIWLKNRQPAKWRDHPEVPALPDAAEDDGFIKALSNVAAEVMADGGDTPENISG